MTVQEHLDRELEALEQERTDGTITEDEFSKAYHELMHEGREALADEERR